MPANATAPAPFIRSRRLGLFMDGSLDFPLGFCMHPPLTIACMEPARRKFAPLSHAPRRNESKSDCVEGAGSEGELKSKLHVARRLAGTDDSCERYADRRIGVAKVRMVQSVKHLPPEFSPILLGDREDAVNP